MSGHSKWANIKRKKGASDAVRGKIFTKIGREIAVAVKAGGADINSNAKLRDVVAKAKANNMPNDNITRSIKKASGELGSINYEEIVYEGYGPGGVAVIVETLTDNKNRTAGDVRHIFDKYNGSMGTNGCVSFMFDVKGVIVIAKSANINDDDMMMAALDAGAEDFSAEGDYYEIITASTDFTTVREALESKNFSFVSSDISRIPQNTVAIDGDNLDRFYKMLEKFEENDDVQEVHHNAELPETEEEED